MLNRSVSTLDDSNSAPGLGRLHRTCSQARVSHPDRECRTILGSMSRTSRSRVGAPIPVPSAPRAKPTSAPVKKSTTTPAPRSRVGETAITKGAVPEGIEYNLRVVRTYGSLAALVPMAVAGLSSMLALWGSTSTMRGLVGFVLAVVSCPTLPIFGFPLATGGTKWLAVVASSAAVWAAVGFVAARRSTTRAVAGWPEWRREWLRLAVGIWIGSLVGFAIAAIILTVDF